MEKTLFSFTSFLIVSYLISKSLQTPTLRSTLIYLTYISSLVGTLSLDDACRLPHIKHRRSNSAQTNYRLGDIDTIIINDSANDEITIAEVNDIRVAKTSYSELEVDWLVSALRLDAKSTDLYVNHIDPEFSSITINNSLSTISLKLNENTNYKLNLDGESLIEGFEMPAALVAPTAPGGYKLDQINGRNILSVRDGSGGTISLTCDKCKFDLIHGV